MIDLEAHQHGSARFASYRDRKKAGLYSGRGAFIGTDDAGRHCYSDQQSAILLLGGARSGKGNFIASWLVDGRLSSNGVSHHIISLDWKGQNGPIAALQVRQGRHIYTFNPRRNPASGYSRMNPLSHLRASSSTLIPDALMCAQSITPFTDPKSQYFQGMAQKIETGVMVVQARRDGVVTFPALADALAGIGSTSEEFLSLEFDLSRQPEPEIRQIALDLQNFRAGKSEGGGFEGIKNEIQKSFTALLDPQMREALSPPYDFDFAWLCEDDFPSTLVNIQEDIEFADISGPIIRALFTSALIHKRRNITSRAQYWLLDEISACGAWPLAVKLATICAGYNIRTAYVAQSLKQLDALAPNAGEIIANSCGTAIYLGTRSAAQAKLVSGQLGRTTIEVIDPARREAARAAQTKAMLGAMQGADPLAALAEAAHQDRLARTPTRMARDLRSPDEVMGESRRAFVFMPGVLRHAYYATVPRYWHRRDLAGAYLGDPFHAKPGTVEIATRWGQRHRKVVTEDTPPALREWPQYRELGQWSYVKGLKP